MQINGRNMIDLAVKMYFANFAIYFYIARSSN